MREKVNISTVTLNGAEIGCIKLERIADFFRVPMDYFFDRDYKQPEPVNTIEKKSEDIINDKSTEKDYKKRIEELNFLVVEQSRMIKILIEQNDRLSRFVCPSESSKESKITNVCEKQAINLQE